MRSAPPSDVLDTRLRHQRLLGTPFRTVADAVRSLGAFQAQDYPGAKWSLGMRVARATDATIDAALDAGKIIRTHLLRPTWHFVAPDDLRWILALGAPQVKRIMSYSHRHVGLTAKTFTRAARVLERELARGRHRTREEVAALLAEEGMSGDGRWLAHLLLELEQEGLICSGKLKGKQQTYALVDEWVKPGPKVGRAEGVGRLAERFFRSHGPATWKQFAWWSGLTLKEARGGRAALDGLKIVTIDGTEWISPPGRPATRDPRQAFLIPEYDELLTGWAEIGIPRLMSDRRKGKPSFTFDRPILIAGTWRGNWRRTLGGRQVDLELERFGKWSAKDEGAVRREGERYARFIGMPVVVR